jgi:hypothetical protein
MRIPAKSSYPEYASLCLHPIPNLSIIDYSVYLNNYKSKGIHVHNSRNQPANDREGRSRLLPRPGLSGMRRSEKRSCYSSLVEWHHKRVADEARVQAQWLRPGHQAQEKVADQRGFGVSLPTGKLTSQPNKLPGQRPFTIKLARFATVRPKRATFLHWIP